MATFNDVIDAIQIAKQAAHKDEDGIATAWVKYGERDIQVVYNVAPRAAGQIAGPAPLNTTIFDWTGNPQLPKLVTKEFLGRE